MAHAIRRRLVTVELPGLPMARFFKEMGKHGVTPVDLATGDVIK